jgi:hypothetical protein
MAVNVTIPAATTWPCTSCPASTARSAGRPKSLSSPHAATSAPPSAAASHGHTLIAAARSQMTASSPRGTFSQAEPAGEAPLTDVPPAPASTSRRRWRHAADDLVELQGAYEDQAGVAGIDPGAPVLPDRRFVTGGDSSAVARHAISADLRGELRVTVLSACAQIRLIGAGLPRHCHACGRVRGQARVAGSRARLGNGSRPCQRWPATPCGPGWGIGFCRRERTFPVIARRRARR